MKLSRTTFRAATLALGIVVGLAGAARADEVTPGHLAAARAAIDAAQNFKGFDNLLPLLAQQTQNRLIRLRPDQHELISQTVDQEALELAARRVDLDNDVARIMAKYFTEEELQQIAAFYKTTAGAKFAELLPKVSSEALQTVKGWSDRVGEELYEKSVEQLKKKGVDL
jgi:uncharacterized protein